MTQRHANSYEHTDLTGVERIDTSTADHLLKVERAASLMGARCVLTGIGPEIAQTMVALGVDLTQLAQPAHDDGGVAPRRVATPSVVKHLGEPVDPPTR